MATTVAAEYLAPWHLIAAAEQRNGHGNGVTVGAKREREGKEELVPAIEKRQDGRARDAGCGDRQHDVAQRAHARRAVQHCCVFEIRRKLAKESSQQPDSERHRERQVGKYESRVGVEEAEARGGSGTAATRSRSAGTWRWRERTRGPDPFRASAGVPPRTAHSVATGTADERRKPGDKQGIADRNEEIRVRQRAHDSAREVLRSAGAAATRTVATPASATRRASNKSGRAARRGGRRRPSPGPVLPGGCSRPGSGE